MTQASKSRRSTSTTVADRRLLVHVVAREESVRERLSTAIIDTPGLRVVSSRMPDAAAATGSGKAPHAIVAYADTQDDCHRIQQLADEHTDAFVVLVLSDVEDWPPPDSRPSSIDHIHRAHADVMHTTLTPLLNEFRASHNGKATSTATLQADDHARLDRLTPREREILTLTAEGLSIEEIARRIHRTFATVAKHRNNIMSKTGLHDRVALARLAIRTGVASA